MNQAELIDVLNNAEIEMAAGAELLDWIAALVSSIKIKFVSEDTCVGKIYKLGDHQRSSQHEIYILLNLIDHLIVCCSLPGASVDISALLKAMRKEQEG